jgi:hypothetical protein
VAIVLPPLAAPPPHSLLRAAITNRDADADWQKGMVYAPEAVGGYRALAGCSAESVDYGTDAGPPAAVEYQPWELEVQDPCSTTFGYSVTATTDRLRRAFDATESYAIAHELWTGELTAADAAAGGPVTNPSLTDAPTVLGAGPMSARRALGELEQAVGDALHGQQAYLHISRLARPFFVELIREGNLLFTNINNLIVADAGYPGTPPDGTAAAPDVAWAYATGPVVVRRTELFLGPDAPAQTIDTATNTVRRTASKVVAATFDPAFLFAVPITLA